MMPPTLQQELKKRQPFASMEQEAMLALMRTSDLLENRMARLLRGYGLTMSQYNVLRILRGEGKPMPCLDVAARMIQVVPAITRVVDQLLKLDYISKVQSTNDKRIFLIQLQPSGKKILAQMDQPVLELHASLFSGVGEKDQKTLIRILQSVRGAIPD